MWQDYRDRAFQVLGLDCWNGSAFAVRGYIAATGSTFPVLRNAGYLQSSSQYGIAYDNYVVVDAAGIVRYTSVGETFTSLGRWNDTNVRAAIDAWLETPVESTTWSRVRELYRGGVLDAGAAGR